MNVRDEYLPRYVPLNYVFYSHMSTNSAKVVADSLKIDESEVLILPYDAKMWPGCSPYSAFVKKSSKWAVDRFNNELDALKFECDIHALASSMLSPKFHDLCLTTFGDSFKMPAYPFGGEFVIPLSTVPKLSGVFSFDIETSNINKSEGSNVAIGDKVSLSWHLAELKGTEVARFYSERDGEHYSTVRLDVPYEYRDLAGGYQSVNFLTGPSRNVRKHEPNGVKLDFDGAGVTWHYNGSTQHFNIGRETARAFAAMAHVNLIQAIKCFRAQYSSGLKESKDVVEAFTREFPRRNV